MKAQRTYFMSLIVLLVDWSYVMLKRFTKTPVYIFFNMHFWTKLVYFFVYLLIYLIIYKSIC